MNEANTWRWSSGLAGWNYRPVVVTSDEPSAAPLVSPKLRNIWLSGLVERLPSLLGDFAYATMVEVATLSQGEDACTLDLREAGSSSALLGFIERTDDVVYISIDLTLCCEDLECQHLELDRGAILWICIELTETGALDPSVSAPVRLRLQLNVDIYAPRSWGKERDNAVLAARNGPRLAAFLDRLERDIPVELIDIDAEDYRGMIGPRGFFTDGV